MLSILQILGERAKANKILIRDMHRAYTFEDIEQGIAEIVNQIIAQDIQVLGLYADNGIDWVLADSACQQAGVTLVPLPTFFSDSQLQYVLNTCQLEAILTDSVEELAASSQNQIAIQNSSLKLCILDKDATKLALPQGTGKITFTSGSTGHPKGVCLSNEQLKQQAKTLAKTVGIHSPKHLCLLPLSTLLENVAGVYAPLLAQGEILLPTLAEMGFKGSAIVDQAKFLSMISKTEPNSIIVIPQLLLFLVSAIKSGWEAPESLQFVAVGGSKVSQDLLLEARSLGIPVYEGYGLSECASVVSLNTKLNDRPGCCGMPLETVNVAIEDNEVMVSGNTMLGYVNEPDSWNQSSIKTGDVGFVDEEGFLHINGRKKNVLISNYGRNISPEWVESELLANPLLIDVVVFGDAQPYCTALIGSRSVNMTNTDIQLWIDLVNKSLPDYARVIAWYRLSESLGAQDNLMTENGRPRREAIYAHYKVEIEDLYSQSAALN